MKSPWPRETKLDKFLCCRDWLWNKEEFVTIGGGVGFVLYKVKLTMMLAGVTPATLDAYLAKEQYWVYDKPGPFGILAHRGGGRLVPHMFEIPATPHVISAAVNSAFKLRL
jgi:hypothetical protein